MRGKAGRDPHRASDDHERLLIEARFSILEWGSAWERDVRIRIERAACVGNARCAAVSAEMFPLDDGGYIPSNGFEVAEDLEKTATNGARACPERIIFVVEDDGTTSWPPAAPGRPFGDEE
jgi:ferredoxin